MILCNFSMCIFYISNLIYMTFSSDLKERVIKYHASHNASYRSIENIFNVGKSTVHRWIHQINHQIKRITMECDDKIEQFMQSNPLTILKVVKKHLNDEYNLNVSISSIWRRLRKLKISRKKVSKRKVLPGNTEAKKKELIDRVRNHNRPINCLDETGFEVISNPRYGYSKKGTRCYFDDKTKRRLKRIHAVFMISKECIVNYELYDEAINQERLIDFLNKSVYEGDILMDNHSVHHGKIVKEYLKNKHVNVLYNVAYSPELNPIEEVFGVLKRSLKLKVIRNMDEMKNAIDEEVKRINKEVKMSNFYKHSYGA